MIDRASGASVRPPRVACIDVGGSGSQTIVFDGDDRRVIEGAHRPPGARLALAVPGAIDGLRVAGASSLGWVDVDPAAELGLAGPPDLVLNDAEAAAIGEWILGGEPRGLLYVGLGTGIGGALVAADGALVATNLLGHRLTHPLRFGDRSCLCGERGCLETEIAGWALPTPLARSDVTRIADLLARAIDTDPHPAPTRVVLAGGIVEQHPDLVGLVGDRLPGREVAPSSRPRGAKSAAAWGLRHVLAGRSGG